MKPLSPPLALIEEGLFGPSAELLLRLAQAPDTVPADLRASVLSETRYAETVEALRRDDSFEIDAAGPDPAPPDWLMERITQCYEAQAAALPKRPEAGQIRAVDAVIGPAGPLDWDLPRPLIVCLEGPYPGRDDIWYGWMVGQETDYAAYWDVVLEDGDASRSPLAGMIQLWNPVYCYLPSTGRTLAQLSPERLAAVRAAATEFLSGEPIDLAPRPGRIAVRKTLGGYAIVTGTPLGDTDDPRWHYRELYKAAAEALREPVKLALDAAREAARQPGLLDRLRMRLEELADLWRPGPALVHAMGGEGEPSAALEGEIAGRLHLRAEAEEGYITLVVTLLGQDPLRLKVVCNGEEIAEYRLDLQHVTETLGIDAEQNCSLHLLSLDGSEIAHFDWSTRT